MPIELNFGDVRAITGRAAPGSRFRIALLGDFSARANTGRLETGEALAGRKSIRIDSDSLDKVIQRLQISLRLQLGGGAVDIAIRSMDDFHPEQLYSNLEIFSELAGLRQRLKTPSTFAKAAAQVQGWAGGDAVSAAPEIARGADIPLDFDLSDFAELLGQPTVAKPEETPVQDLLRQIVGPHIIPAKDPRQDTMVAAVDEALSETMRTVLHHPDFQALEALWRSADLLVRQLETGPQLEILLFDISAEELAADLSNGDALDQSGLYRLLVEQPALDAHQGAFSTIVANYTFSRTKAHAELLGRLAKVASEAQAGCVAAISSAILSENPDDLPPEITEAWAALRALPDAVYLTLATPSFMLRQPYGSRSEPVDCFTFEEITPKTGLTGFLWGNPATLAGLLLGQSSTAQGKKMVPGSALGVGDMPFYYYTDKDGDQEALPCTEKALTIAMAASLNTQGFVPLLSLKGSPDVRLGGFHSIAGPTLAGPWAPVAVSRQGAAAGGAATAAAPVAVQAEAAATPEPAAETAVAPDGLDALDAPVAETPAEAPEASDSTGDPDLDALLAGLSGDTPEASGDGSAPAAETQPGDLDPDLDALLAGL